jgi:hypothetical protein
VPVTSKKKMGMIHNSFNFSGKETWAIGGIDGNGGGPGERKKATLEKRRQGVKKLTLIEFNFWE